MHITMIDIYVRFGEEYMVLRKMRNLMLCQEMRVIDRQRRGLYWFIIIIVIIVLIIYCLIVYFEVIYIILMIISLKMNPIIMLKRIADISEFPHHHPILLLYVPLISPTITIIINPPSNILITLLFIILSLLPLLSIILINNQKPIQTNCCHNLHTTRCCEHSLPFPSTFIFYIVKNWICADY